MVSIQKQPATNLIGLFWYPTLHDLCLSGASSLRSREHDNIITEHLQTILTNLSTIMYQKGSCHYSLPASFRFLLLICIWDQQDGWTFLWHSPEDEQSILFETSRPHRFFSEPTLLPKEFYGCTSKFTQTDFLCGKVQQGVPLPNFTMPWDWSRMWMVLCERHKIMQVHQSSIAEQ